MKTFMFVLAAILVVGFNALAQDVPNGEIGISVDVSGNPLVVANVADESVVGLTPGITAALVPDGAGAFLDGADVPNPVYSNIVSNSTPGQVEVSGESSGAVILSFALPYALYSDGSTSGIVHMDYNGTSACWVNASASGEVHYFNPKNAETIILDPTEGNVTDIYLGGIFTVDAHTEAGVYTGTALVTAAYASN